MCEDGGKYSWGYTDSTESYFSFCSLHTEKEVSFNRTEKSFFLFMCRWHDVMWCEVLNFPFQWVFLVLYQKFYWTAMNYVSFLAVFIPQVRRRKPFLWLFVNFPDVGEFPSTAFKYAGWQGSCSVPLVKLLFGFLASTLQGLWVIYNPRWDIIAFGCRAPRGESWRLYRIPIWGGTQEPKSFITFTSRVCRGL